MDPRERLTRIRTELKALFLERDELVDGALLALLARHHILLIGPPGTAKSMLAQELCRRISGFYFEWLLTKFTTPEELFGPVSVPALEEGRFERVTAGKLPEAEVVFLDEVFKANSAILNSLLTVMNERRYYQGTKVMDVPLRTLLSASNELPEEDDLDALYDRFLLRFTVGYIEHDHHFRDLLTRADNDDATTTTLTSDQLEALQLEVERVTVPERVVADIADIRNQLQTEGVIASDRRYRQSLGVLRAAALLDGRDAVTPSDLRWLEHILWSDPEDRRKVLAALAEVSGGLDDEARRLVQQAEEIDAYASRAWPNDQARQRALLEAHTKLEELRRRIEAMTTQATGRGRETGRLEECAEKVASIQRDLLASHPTWLT